MDGLTLLSEGRAAGLTVTVDGDRLVIRGPKSADAVARRLLAHKAVILAALAAGNGGGAPAIPEVVNVVEMPDFDSLPLPGDPCLRCGSLEKWWDILGGEHCQQCQRATLDKALQLADLAARLRQKAQPRKPAPRIAPGCVAAGSVDILDTDNHRPVQSQPRGLCGV